MDYTGQKCQVCGIEFTENDDIVVCPICGTPHHRDCYNELGRCVNEEKHNDNYDWNKENKPKEENKCKNCGFVNGEEMLFCGKCGTPLGENSNSQNTPPKQAPPTGNPFITQGADGAPHLNLDPLAGVPPETTFDENVTAQDLADVTKVNSFYYMNVFSRLKKVGSGKFSFAAFFFGSIWWIYRKNYAVGIVLFLFTLLTTFLSIYLLPTSIEITNGLINQYGASPSQEQMLNYVDLLSDFEKFAFFFPAVLQIINLIIMFASGFLANRFYYKHCIKLVQKVKKTQQDKLKIKKELTKLGGINNKVAFACAACIFAITIAQLFI